MARLIDYFILIIRVRALTPIIVALQDHHLTNASLFSKVRLRSEAGRLKTGTRVIEGDDIIRAEENVTAN